MRKFTEENKQLAAQLHEQMKALQGKPAPSTSKSAKKGRANGSDFSSARGSEERGSMAAQGGGRAPRRLRDYDLEQVCEFYQKSRMSVHATNLFHVLLCYQTL